jgi:hypothetical protein
MVKTQRLGFRPAFYLIVTVPFFWNFQENDLVWVEME